MVLIAKRLINQAKKQKHQHFDLILQHSRIRIITWGSHFNVGFTRYNVNSSALLFGCCATISHTIGSKNSTKDRFTSCYNHLYCLDCSWDKMAIRGH